MSDEPSAAAGPLPVHQARGEETLARLVEAAAEVIGERGVDGASIAAITERARTSVGNFYRRFPDKAALLAHLQRDVLAGRPEFWERTLTPERWRGREPEELLAHIVAEIVYGHARHRQLLRAIALHARDDYEASVSALDLDLPGRVHELAARLWPGRIRHPDPRLAVRLGFEMVAATAGELLLFRGMSAPVAPDALAVELTRAWAAYLGLSPVPS